MRVGYQDFIDALAAYLEAAFTERVEAWNALGGEVQLEDIAEWGGTTAVLQGCQSYPACIILPSGRRMSAASPYFTRYRVTVGIALTGNDPPYLVRQGQAWEDILEDSIRSDWSLGGACLDTGATGDISSDWASDLYVISCELECELDLGGYVYG